jgi:hypothetical protein
VGLTDRFDAWQQRHPALGLPLAVIYKYVDDQGSYLAALIAYYALVSLFPLLLLLSTVLGWVLTGHPELLAHVEHSALSEFPVIGPQLCRPKQLSGGDARGSSGRTLRRARRGASVAECDEHRVDGAAQRAP